MLSDLVIVMSSMDGISLPASLAEAKITSLPSTAYYIPNFISEHEEKNILDKVEARIDNIRPSRHLRRADKCDSRLHPPQNRDGSSSPIAGCRHGRPTWYKTNS